MIYINQWRIGRQSQKRDQGTVCQNKTENWNNRDSPNTKMKIQGDTGEARRIGYSDHKKTEMDYAK